MSKRDAILEAATSLFSENGFRDTSMAELCALSGVAEGTVFYHFKNKVELFLTALEEVKKTILSAFEEFAAERSFSNGLEKTMQFADYYLHLAEAMENGFRLLHRNFSYDLAEGNPRCKGILEEFYSNIWSIFEKAIAEGQADGTVRDMPPHKAALLVFALLDGVVHYRTHRLQEIADMRREALWGCQMMLQASPKGEQADF